MSEYDPAGARADRDAGMDATLAWNRAWREQAHYVIAGLAQTKAEFTSEDVTEIVGLPPGGSPNAVGAVVNAAARRGLIRRVGDVQAKRRNQHATRIGLWVGSEEGAE